MTSVIPVNVPFMVGSEKTITATWPIFLDSQHYYACHFSAIQTFFLFLPLSLLHALIIM